MTESKMKKILADQLRREHRKQERVLKRLLRGNQKGSRPIRIKGDGWVWKCEGSIGKREYMGYDREEARAMYQDEMVSRIERLMPNA